MKRYLVISMLACWGIVGTCRAGDSTEAGVPTSALSTYSGGFGVGAFKAIDNQLQIENKQFLKLAFENTIYFRKYVGAFLDADAFLPGTNFDANVGFDFIASSSDFRPFAGVGVGIGYFGKSGTSFNNNFGPSATAHVGVAVDLSRSVEMRLRIPYQFVGNKASDKVAGLEVGFLFSDKFKNTRKLDYDKK
jgi:hypothetical protein